jgi:hypothetical protein
VIRKYPFVVFAVVPISDLACWLGICCFVARSHRVCAVPVTRLFVIPILRAPKLAAPDLMITPSADSLAGFLLIREQAVYVNNPDATAERGKRTNKNYPGHKLLLASSSAFTMSSIPAPLHSLSAGRNSIQFYGLFYAHSLSGCSSFVPCRIQRTQLENCLREEGCL